MADSLTKQQHLSVMMKARAGSAKTYTDILDAEKQSHAILTRACRHIQDGKGPRTSGRTGSCHNWKHCLEVQIYARERVRGEHVPGNVYKTS